MNPTAVKMPASVATATAAECVPTGLRIETKRHSYDQILKSSALIGGSSIITIAANVIRAKAFAVLLGPAGVGLVGLYSSIVELTRSVAGMGINASGVRQIAEAVGSGEARRIARTAIVLRRTSLVLAIIGAGLLVAFRDSIAEWTFGNRELATPVALLSVAVFLQLISDGQAALIQGMRRIADLARMAVITGVTGSAVSLILVYFLRGDGVIPALVSTAAITLAVSWWHRRRVSVPLVPVGASEARKEAEALLKLGSAFMASAVLPAGSAYVIRAFLGNNVGLDAAGLYQSAWTLGGLYVGFILQAMGSDFYPRLTAVVRDHHECNRLVNEQAQISLLLAGPGVLATLTFAPLVIATFYASSFAAAVEPLRWICLGMALRVVAWPMGFIVLAKGARGIFFFAEVAANAVHIGLALSLGRWLGLLGATMAYFGLYVWHGILIYAVVRRLTGFKWSPESRRIGARFLFSLATVFCGFVLLPTWLATAIGSLATLTSAVHSLRVICTLMSLDRLPAGVRALLVRARIVTTNSPMATACE
jgi:PST family polysaccharide transporter